jgi:hypothetical protein
MHLTSNDELERRAASQASNEGTLSTTSIFSELHRSYRPRVRSKRWLDGDGNHAAIVFFSDGHSENAR